VKENDPKQRIWFVFDNALVLPEYLVELDYVQTRKENRLSSLGSFNGNVFSEDSKSINQECN
jgi:hypothetical protein